MQDMRKFSGLATPATNTQLSHGYGYLLGDATSNAKTAKGLKLFPDITAAIMYLTPATLADGIHNICPWSTAGCRASCLNTAGRAQVSGPLEIENLKRSGIHRARRNRTLHYVQDKRNFLDTLALELHKLHKRATRKQHKAVARLNGTSDIPFESIASEIFCTFPDVQFYDYTKSQRRAEQFAAGKLPANYHLTFSRSEDTCDSTVVQLISEGTNVAVVFRDSLPARFLGIPVIDGNAHDFRHLDPKGVIVGLTAKGRARNEISGFVVEVADPRACNCGPTGIGHNAGCHRAAGAGTGNSPRSFGGALAAGLPVTVEHADGTVSNLQFTRN